MVTEDEKFFRWGVFFLLIQLLAIVRNLTSDYFSFFWYCDFTPGFFALFFFLKKSQAIKGLLNIGFFGQIIYALIFLFKLTTGISLFGWVFEFGGNFYMISTLIIHLSTSFALVAVYKTKPDKTALLYSLVFLVLIYSAVLTFTSPSYSIDSNYNFIYYSAVVTPYVPHYYTQLWVLLAFAIVVIPTHLFQYVIYRLYKKREKLKEKKVPKKTK